jgi:RimJ/RimL family protein N-acetyltransferase
VNLPPPTPRLAFRPLSPDDLPFAAAMLGDPDVMRYYPRCYSTEEARAWLARQAERYARDGHGLWLVSAREGGEPVGQVGLLMQQVDGAAELEVGYLIHRPFWRRGYATEAARACRDHAFVALGRRRVISLIRPENLPSQGVARKMGMTPEKRTTFAGLDHFVFAVSRSDGEASSAVPGP